MDHTSLWKPLAPEKLYEVADSAYLLDYWAEFSRPAAAWSMYVLDFTYIPHLTAKTRGVLCKKDIHLSIHLGSLRLSRLLQYDTYKLCISRKKLKHVCRVGDKMISKCISAFQGDFRKDFPADTGYFILLWILQFMSQKIQNLSLLFWPPDAKNSI
jgi:hypothetical protein